jgi:anti-sigma regulatory factor (Ser/Thr protein kinase)
MDQITVPARKENLQDVLEFVVKHLELLQYSTKALLRLELSVEEAYVNIVNYAYDSDDGEIVIGCRIDENPSKITVQFIDSGIPFNPLKNEDPDVLSGIDEKEPGGLGIFLIKKNVDKLYYEYYDGKNILTIQKVLTD